MIGNVNSWGVDVFRVAELVNEGRALTCITYKIFQVTLLMICLICYFVLNMCIGVLARIMKDICNIYRSENFASISRYRIGH